MTATLVNTMHTVRQHFGFDGVTEQQVSNLVRSLAIKIDRGVHHADDDLLIARIEAATNRPFEQVVRAALDWALAV